MKNALGSKIYRKTGGFSTLHTDAHDRLNDTNPRTTSLISLISQVFTGFLRARWCVPQKNVSPRLRSDGDMASRNIGQPRGEAGVCVCVCVIFLCISLTSLDLHPLDVEVVGAASISTSPVPAPLPPLRVDFPPLRLPNDSQGRVRPLPSNTMLHVPQSCRLRIIAVVARCWNGLAAAWMSMPWHRKAPPNSCWPWCQGALERGDEVSKRIELCERSEFEALLGRCEQQEVLNQKHKKRKRQPQRDGPAGRGDRARRTAAAGAHQKSTSGLVSSTMEMSDSEDRQWASMIIPNSDLSSGIYIPPNHEPEVCDPRSGFDHPFSRLRYAALAAPGPTGTRAEHITDLLDVSRRTHANKVHKPLTRVFLCISGGELPPTARWLTRTRLCWQCKKNGTPQIRQNRRILAVGVRQGPGQPCARTSPACHPGYASVGVSTCR